MIEHRLIERAIRQMSNELDRARAGKGFDVRFIDSWVDFVRTYADQVHHGKEEKILFHDLEGRPLSAELRQMMAGLIEDHVKARKMVSDLVAARDQYAKGEQAVSERLLQVGAELVGFYPAHIRKEDQEFFIPVMDYFTKEEKDDMLKRFQAFDEGVIHEHYRSVVESMEKRPRAGETI